METISTRRSTCEIFTGSSAIRMRAAEVAFRQSYPAFENTSLLDELREREYARLDEQGHLYLDYTGVACTPRANSVNTWNYCVVTCLATRTRAIQPLGR